MLFSTIESTLFSVVEEIPPRWIMAFIFWTLDSINESISWGETRYGNIRFDIFLHLSSTPNESTTTRPLYYLSSNSASKFEPIKPVAPVTIIIVLFYLLFLLMIGYIQMGC